MKCENCETTKNVNVCWFINAKKDDVYSKPYCKNCMDGLVSIGDSVYESKEAAERELNDYYESGADIQEEMYGINYHSY